MKLKAWILTIFNTVYFKGVFESLWFWNQYVWKNSGDGVNLTSHILPRNFVCSSSRYFSVCSDKHSYDLFSFWMVDEWKLWMTLRSSLQLNWTSECLCGVTFVYLERWNVMEESRGAHTPGLASWLHLLPAGWPWTNYLDAETSVFSDSQRG